MQNICSKWYLENLSGLVRTILAGVGSSVSVEMVDGEGNGRITQKRLAEVSEILKMLAALGQIVENEGKFATQT